MGGYGTRSHGETEQQRRYVRVQFCSRELEARYTMWFTAVAVAVQLYVQLYGTSIKKQCLPLGTTIMIVVTRAITGHTSSESPWQQDSLASGWHGTASGLLRC